MIHTLYAALALFLGYLGGLGFAPDHLTLATIIALTILFLILQPNMPWRQHALIALCWGIGLHIHSSIWIFASMQVKDLPVVLALLLTFGFTVYLALYSAAAAIVAWHLYHLKWFAASVTISSVWLIFEWLKGTVIDGFPWLTLGYISADTALSKIIPWLGVYGASWTIFISAFWLAAWLKKMNQPAPLVCAIALIISITFIQPSGTIKSEGSINVTLVQPNIKQAEKWKIEQFYPSLRTLLSLSEQNATKTDLIIWPETAVANYWQYTPNWLKQAAAELTKNNNVPILSGAISGNKTTYGNSVCTFGGDCFYTKRRIVPFAEYVPLSSVFSYLPRAWGLEFANFSKGNPIPENFILKNDIPIAFNICYELAFWNSIAPALPQAQAVINISNEAWFSGTNEAHQLLQMGQIRALESGRAIARSTNNGLTAIIDNDGRILHQLPANTRAALNAPLPLYSGSTPFSRYGNYWLWLLMPIIIIGLIVSVGNRSRMLYNRQDIS